MRSWTYDLEKDFNAGEQLQCVNVILFLYKLKSLDPGQWTLLVFMVVFTTETMRFDGKTY